MNQLQQAPLPSSPPSPHEDDRDVDTHVAAAADDIDDCMPGH